MDIYYKIALINLVVFSVSRLLFKDYLGRNTMSDKAKITCGAYFLITALFTLTQLIRFLWLL